MGRSITEGLYLSPLTRNGADQRVKESDLKNMDDVDTLYSIRGEAPEGWYNAGTRKHASKGSGYEDHQIFKKLPEAKKAEETKPSADETPKPKDKDKDNKEKVSRAMSLAESIKNNVVSSSIMDASDRNQQESVRRSSGQESADRYGDSSAVRNDGFTQDRAFNYLQDYKLDLKTKYGK